VYYRFDRRRRQTRADRRAAELEFKALRAQMNPHFLFNALNSIHDYILENEAEVAADYLSKFSKLMRQVLEMSRLNEVPLQRELNVLGMYVELERMRLESRFNMAVDIATEVDPETVTVPPMILQPFVENAIWHGLSQKDGPGHLRISVSKTGYALCIAIEDDGVGRFATASKGSDHTSLGTSITKERLDLWAAQRGVPASFIYMPVPIGTRVELVLPWAEV
jgi:LytS/YehU family sensor histidine kinase